MKISDEELKAMLVEEDEELRGLVVQHQEYEEQLLRMDHQRYLSESEQREMAILKKKKLRGKDRIYQILAAWRRAHQA